MMNVLEKIEAAGPDPAPVPRAEGGAGAKIRVMLGIVDRFDRAGVAPAEVAELRGLLVSALACCERGEDHRRDGARVIALCEFIVASIPLQGAALRSAVVRILGGATTI
jgi:hypothetical protein